MIASTVTIDASEDAVAGNIVPRWGRIHEPLLTRGCHERTCVVHPVEFGVRIRT